MTEKKSLPGGFSTFEEFFDIWETLSDTERLAWAKTFSMEQLTIKDREKLFEYCVVHAIALDNCFPEEFWDNREILLIPDSCGATPVHYLGSNAGIPEKRMTAEYLLIQNEYTGVSVAHEMAENDVLPPEYVTPEIAEFEDDDGVKVRDLLPARYRGEKDPEPGGSARQS